MVKLPNGILVTITIDDVDSSRTDADEELRRETAATLGTQRRLLYDTVAEAGDVSSGALHAKYEDGVRTERLTDSSTVSAVVRRKVWIATVVRGGKALLGGQCVKDSDGVEAPERFFLPGFDEFRQVSIASGPLLNRVHDISTLGALREHAVFVRNYCSGRRDGRVAERADAKCCMFD